MQKQSVMWLMLILIVAVVTEAGLAAFLPLAFPTSGHLYLWNPDFAQVRRAWAADAGGSDDEIGWPSAQEDTSPPRDRTGAKANPDFPDIGHACISVYGDSFVWGENIPLADGWLSSSLGSSAAGSPIMAFPVTAPTRPTYDSLEKSLTRPR